MLPSFLLVGAGTHRRFWVPLPVFLLWPFWLLGWPIWFLLWLFRTPWEKPLRVILILALGFSGLRVDVDAKDGTRIHIRLI